MGGFCTAPSCGLGGGVSPPSSLARRTTDWVAMARAAGSAGMPSGDCCEIHRPGNETSGRNRPDFARQTALHSPKKQAVMSKQARLVESSFRLARERYAGLGVDVDRALRYLAKIPVSLHCWQGDDLGGFEKVGGAPGGGLAVTGNYPGKARTAGELRMDLEKALS